MGPTAIPIAALAVSAAAAGYGIYAAERAKVASQRAVDQARQDQQRYQQQQQQQQEKDKADMAANLASQQQTQTATNTALAAEQEAARQKALASVPGMQQQLGSDLLSQEQTAYQRMAPQLESRLNALGLLQSGALPEAQAKYQGDLEAQRQQQLAQFGINAQQQLNVQAPMALSEADVNRQSQAMQANLALSQQNLSQQFANQNIGDQNNLAYQQYVGQLQGAQNSAAQQAAGAYMNFGGQIGQGALSYYGNKYNQPNPSTTQPQRQWNYWGTGNQGPVR